MLGAIIVSIIMLGVIMLSVVKPNVALFLASYFVISSTLTGSLNQEQYVGENGNDIN
jgi:hypothetical protein